MDVIRSIKTFRAVVEEKSFSKAANRLGVVVSAVSRQVSELEHHFGCQLLYRTTRSMHLTAEGEYYLEQFEEVVDRLQRLETRAQVNQTEMVGQLRITAPPDAEELGITRSVSKFAATHPNVKLNLLLVNRYVNLAQEGIDLAVRVHELSDSRLIARHYTDLNILFVASPEYLEKHGIPKHPRLLGEHKCVLDNSIRSPSRWRYFENGDEHHIVVSGQLEVNDGKITADYAAKGNGIAFLPDFLVKSYLDRGELVPILSEFVSPPVPVSLVYPANRLKNPVLTEFVKHLLASAPSNSRR